MSRALECQSILLRDDAYDKRKSYSALVIGDHHHVHLGRLHFQSVAGQRMAVVVTEVRLKPLGELWVEEAERSGFDTVEALASRLREVALAQSTARDLNVSDPVTVILYDYEAADARDQ